jgi:TatD DNase family protein
MLLVDVHAHLDLEGYEKIGGISNVIAECERDGVKIIISNGINIESNRKVLDIASKHGIVRAALGIYPTHCLEMIEAGEYEEFDKEIKFIEKKVKEKKCIAIGEVGLEYKEIPNITDAQKNIQKDCLRQFVNLAKKCDIPIIIHSRNAELEVVELLEQEGMKDKKVIMHCFCGRKHIVKRIRDNGWSFSIPCNIIRSQQFQEIARDTPLEQLFTETDSPLLSPEKDTVNRPSNVIVTIKKIAELKKMTPEEVANIIYNNYQKLFL